MSRYKRHAVLAILSQADMPYYVRMNEQLCYSANLQALAERASG